MAIQGNTKKITVEQANTLMQGMAAANDNRFVKQEANKGLSTNDFDAAAKSKLDGISSATTAAEGLVQLSSATDSDSETVAATAKAVKAAYDLANGKADASTVSTLVGEDTDKSARTIANEELAKQLIPENAKESLDTLAEIAAWIQSHPDDASAMNEAIAALQAKGTLGTDADSKEYATVKAYVEAYVAAQVGEATEVASEQDITDIVNGLYADNG